MRRTMIHLLVAGSLLAIGCIAGSLVQAAQPAGNELSQGKHAADTPTPSHFVYLPLVVRDSGPSIVIIVNEGFEAPLGSGWEFWDNNGPDNGDYTWARRDCRPYNGDYSAWAVGGGADGSSLSCGSDYPDSANSWMAYGPFSLADATTASLSYRLWLNVGPELGADNFCVHASPDGVNFTGYCQTYEPTGCAPVTLRLDDDLLGVNMLGQPEVWIAFQFASDGSTHSPEAAYVDDVVVRKCIDGACPQSGGSASVFAAGRVERSRGSPRAAPSEKSYGSGR
jgi:hypothetical protein